MSQEGFNYAEEIKKLREKFPDHQVDWNYEHNVSICERSKTVIEPLISEEFFLSYDNDFEHPSVNPHQPKYLIFDFDGVLADTSNVNLKYWAQVWFDGDRVRAKKQRDEYFDAPQHGKKHNLSPEELAERQQRSYDSNKFMLEHGFEMFDEFLDEIEKIPNAKLAIVSSGSRELIIWPKIRDYRLAFSHVLGMEDGHSKEDKVEKVCRDWGVSPKDVYYFTDTRSDVVELRDYMDPTKIIGCPWGWCDLERLQDVLPEQQILKNFADIHRIFSRTNLKELSLKGINETNFYPADFKERGKNFIHGIRDWCISRDLTWGHKIPVWYNLTTNPERKFYSYGEWLRDPAVRQQFTISPEKTEAEGDWVQEEKILDTWFSSSLWPLSTLDFVETVKPKKTIVIIHGGNSFEERDEYLAYLAGKIVDLREEQVDWKSSLRHRLKHEGWEVFAPQMPNRNNADYAEWKIWFDKVLDQIDPQNDLYLIGHSLGGNFLPKYLSEHAVKVKQLHLVAPCTDLTSFALGEDLSLISENTEKIYLYHSSDDEVVPITESAKLKELLPKAEFLQFTDRGHFNQPHFPEIEDYLVHQDKLNVWSFYSKQEPKHVERYASHGVIYNPRTHKFLFGLFDKKRVRNLSFDNLYHPIGGKIEKGEDPQTAFLRELEEESGLLPKDLLRLVHVGPVFHGFTLWINEEELNVHLTSEIFYVETESELEGFIEESQESRWLTLEEVNEQILPGYKMVVDIALQKALPVYASNQITNQSWPKKEVLVAHGIIRQAETGQILIVQPKPDEKTFVFPGGGVYDLENIQSAWLREVEEETGVKPVDLTWVKPAVKTEINFSVEDKQQNYHVTGVSYVAETPKTELVSCPEGEARWIYLEELQNEWHSFYPELEDFYFWFLRNFNHPEALPCGLRGRKQNDFEEFYSTQTMVTAKEIFYLWIVRMITLGKYFTGRIPFEDLVITPTILDEKGRKMSKSLKNGLEPGEAIAKFSSDSLRMSMMGGMIPGRNMRFGGNLADRLMENYRNFGNKVWNVARFLEGKGTPPTPLDREVLGARQLVSEQASEGSLSAYAKGSLETEGREGGFRDAGGGTVVVQPWAIIVSCYGLYDQEKRSPEEIQGLEQYFSAVARAIVAQAKENPQGLIVLSGGITSGGEISEAESSLSLLEKYLTEFSENLNSRIILETDSQTTPENLAFGFLRAQEIAEFKQVLFFVDKVREERVQVLVDNLFNNQKDFDLRVRGFERLDIHPHSNLNYQKELLGKELTSEKLTKLKSLIASARLVDKTVSEDNFLSAYAKGSLESEGQEGGFGGAGGSTFTLAPASFWILGKYLELEEKLEANTKIYELAHCVDALYDFLWNNFADWYVEYLKTAEDQVPFARELFKRFVVTLSPYLPFECEVIWEEFFGEENLLAFTVQDQNWARSIWLNGGGGTEDARPSQNNSQDPNKTLSSREPNSSLSRGVPDESQVGGTFSRQSLNMSSRDSENLSQEFQIIIDFIQDLRSTRGLFAIDPGTAVQVYTKSKLLHRYSKFVQVMARSELVNELRPEFYLVKKSEYEYSLDILTYVQDKEGEVGRTNKLIQDLEKQIASLEKQLANESFLQNADIEVVEDKRNNLVARQSELDEQKTKLQFLQ